MTGRVSPALVLHKTPPSTIPGLRTFHTDSTLSTPSSEESNSPTELNKRLADKPPLVKRLAVVNVEDDPTPKHIELDNNRYTLSGIKHCKNLISRPISSVKKNCVRVASRGNTDIRLLSICHSDLHKFSLSVSGM